MAQGSRSSNISIPKSSLLYFLSWPWHAHSQCQPQSLSFSELWHKTTAARIYNSPCSQLVQSVAPVTIFVSKVHNPRLQFTCKQLSCAADWSVW